MEPKHYPVKRLAHVGGYSDGYPAEITGTEEIVLCGCTHSLEYDYGHEVDK